jgi:hypothetical protein
MRPGVWARWQAAAGPWLGWSVCPSLLAPEADTIRPVAEQQVQATAKARASRLADQLAAALGENGGVLVLLDLEPVLGVHVAARLNHARVANAVLVLPRWPYRQAILPVDGLLHALVTQARQLSEETQLPNVVFVCDAARARPINNRPISDQRADNRYRLLASDLPNLAALRTRGIRRIEKISAR